jgi:hypothetical protein
VVEPLVAWEPFDIAPAEFFAVVCEDGLVVALGPLGKLLVRFSHDEFVFPDRLAALALLFQMVRVKRVVVALPLVIEVFEPLQKNKIGDLLDGGEGISDAAGPKLVPEFLDVGFELG